ncbi:TetR family transcriptional regulator C-terminal domain-containing protein [Streptomyces sp. S.PB5]|uniref:TetR family transcriptional regulator C-terminal domain-containing protein n=1 Tax=Streptomyces sp. S.PB5 TaxID=3020844 RepID=UPI0025B0D07C|nr:TetR family transcriptional regulator C-terminal domain-containing protein [Streptomyces sp. S.PB5]MDN3023922.1 TetR family transcriptional regulator C-terminal domain-containing protein [Streptomyces sp. S.PB5]
MTEQRLDGRVERGNRTRRLVLRRTVAIASLEGLDSLSLGRLSTELQLSKSGVFALFGSKEELQLATIRAASRIYLDTVVTPALAHPPGLYRLWALSESWLRYSSRRVFPGGCFFQKAMTEYGSRPGPVQDALRAADTEWRTLVRQTLTEALDTGELAPGADTAQLAFEVIALWEAANLQSVLTDSDEPYDRARAGVRRLLGAVSTAGADFLATPAGD